MILQFVPFNSRDIKHKSIFGSIAAGERLRLAVLMPRSFSCSAVRLIIKKDGGDYEKKEMYWCGMEGEELEWWDISFSVDDPALYYYRFTYETPFGTGNIFLRSSGCGEFAPTGKDWQLTVYSPFFSTPEWVKGGIMYQIFPDRFFNSGTKKSGVPEDRIIHKSFDEPLCWRPDGDGKIRNNDYYGGDLKGITQKLGYIKSLGVNMIYLNPIFEAHENHRYNTADYLKTDPLLGSDDDFRTLCSEAEKLNIKIIIDGVFSHTGSDSIYFNKEKRYGSGGAFNDENSEYREWFTFNADGTYESWWGIDTLPETDEENDSFIRFITESVIEKWFSLGAGGIRLDVADELPDKFIDALRLAVKKRGSDNFIIGEVWEDASDKISHGGRRRYLLGEQLDSVMNYPFADAIISFMRYGRAESFMEAIVSICENYPKCVLDCLMNHIGTHDTPRILSNLTDYDIGEKPRHIQALRKMSENDKKRAVSLLKTASVIQYTLPGFPSVYYGDEAGLTGGSDPFCRACFPWNGADTALTEHYIKLGKIRNSLSCLRSGAFRPYSAMLSCAAYIREDESEKIMVIVNKNPHEISYTVPDEFTSSRELFGDIYVENAVTVNADSAVILYKLK